MITRSEWEEHCITMSTFNYETDSMIPESPARFVLEDKKRTAGKLDYIKAMEARQITDRPLTSTFTVPVSRIRDELFLEGIDADDYVIAFRRMNGGHDIYFHPKTFERLGDECGANDWFLHNNLSRKLQNFYPEGNENLPMAILEHIVSGKAKYVESYNGFVYPTKIDKLPEDEMRLLLSEGIDRDTRVPTYSNRGFEIFYRPDVGEKFGQTYKLTFKGRELMLPKKEAKQYGY